jgi:hypothetical protein
MKISITSKTCNLESFGENVRLHSVIIPRRYVKGGKAEYLTPLCERIDFKHLDYLTFHNPLVLQYLLWG